jgi:hypothetical protein
MRLFARKVDHNRPQDRPAHGIHQTLLTPRHYGRPSVPHIPACACADVRRRAAKRCARKTQTRTGTLPMKRALPEKMFADDQTRMSALRAWVLDQGVTEIEMKERQFWNFAALQPVSEKPWVSFMGRQLRVPDMPEDAQRCLGIHDPQRPGSI